MRIAVAHGDYLQHGATTWNGRIDGALRRHYLSRESADELRIAVGQVESEADNPKTVEGAISRPDADRINQKLTDAGRILTRQP